MRLVCACVGLAIAGCRPPAAVPPPAPVHVPDHEHYIERLAEHATTPLDEVAQAVAKAATEGHVVPARVLRDAMAAHLGVGTWPHVLIARGDDSAIARQLERALAELQAATAIADVATATAHGPLGGTGVIVAVSPPNIAHVIERTGDVATLRVTTAELGDVEAFAVDPSGAAKRLATTSAGGELAMAVACTRMTPAPIIADASTDSTEALELPAAPSNALAVIAVAPVIELHADGRVVATIVDACGPVAAAELDAYDAGPPATTRIEIEQRVFELVNRERVAHGLAAVAWDPFGHDFARAHSEDMARLGYVSHSAPDGATYPERIAAAHLLVSPTHENVGRAWGPGEVHVAFLGSPGHRKNLLADDVANGAVGIAADPGDARLPGAFYITEFFRTIR